MKKLSFSELSLSSEMQQAIEAMGFVDASPIQSEAIPVLLQGHDVIGQAQTGTGKTAAFGIPLLELLDTSVKETTALVMCPTRELAVQVAMELKKLARFKKGVVILPVYGGEQIQKQIMALRRTVHIVVGTPGRIMDHMERGTLNFASLKMVVLDEADEMLNMGFREDIETILKDSPKDKQTVLFSATMPKPILDLTKRFQKNPKLIKVTKNELTTSAIEQIYYETSNSQKLEVITQLIDLHNLQLMLVFCNTKRKVDEIVEQFHNLGLKAEAIHGDLRQNQRDNVLAKFRKGQVNILVATDVAARGIDVENVDAVFNYDIPLDPENYVHRIGRTGRAGKTGRAFIFVTGRNEMGKLREIEGYSKVKIERHQLPSGRERIELAKLKLAARLKELIEEGGDIDQYEAMAANFKNEGITLHHLAAALLKMHFAPMMKKPEPARSSRSFGDEGGRDSRGRGDRGDRADRGERSGDGSRSRKHQRDSRMVRLFLSVGKKDRITKGDIVGSIASLANISSSEIGIIDVYDKFSFVEVNGDELNNILSNVNGNKIKGRKVSVEIAKD